MPVTPGAVSTPNALQAPATAENPPSAPAADGTTSAAAQPVVIPAPESVTGPQTRVPEESAQVPDTDPLPVRKQVPAGTIQMPGSPATPPTPLIPAAPATLAPPATPLTPATPAKPATKTTPRGVSYRPSGAPRGRRAARKPRIAMSAIFADLVDMADIPRSSYAVDEEVTGAMCLFKTDGGYEVFSCGEDARHEVRFFEEEEAAYFYLFGVLTADALRNGRLTPKQD
jgi:hypothetical protein